ncbi:hypothetical protein [Novispirillum itersonii]|uniref:hypothetical protein n=1 Tax=Novispirillum itersonii TaxID=189 RepID=UPI00036C3239|nr:hypothetical protein [Novispirillum itersonii]
MIAFKDLPIIDHGPSTYKGPIITETRVAAPGWDAWLAKDGKYYYEFGGDSHGGITRTVEITREEFLEMREQVWPNTSIDSEFYAKKRPRAFPPED